MPPYVPSRRMFFSQGTDADGLTFWVKHTMPRPIPLVEAFNSSFIRPLLIPLEPLHPVRPELGHQHLLVVDHRLMRVRAFLPRVSLLLVDQIAAMCRRGDGGPEAAGGGERDDRHSAGLVLDIPSARPVVPSRVEGSLREI